MATIAKISVIKKPAQNANGVQGSLQKYGYTRFPNTSVRLPPYKDGPKYRTGLDEDALYIKKMSPEEQKVEKARVRELLQKVRDLYGDQDFSPSSDFYTKMTDAKMGTDERCPFAKLQDGDNIFNLNNKYDLVIYAYLRVHPQIAPSAQALLTGNYPKCMFYVSDQDVEDEVAYKTKQKINKAAKVLDDLTLQKRKMIARQCGLNVTDESSEKSVYRQLDDFIKSSEKAISSGNVDKFFRFVNMQDDNLAILDTIKQAFTYNVLRKKSGRIYRGEYEMAKDEDELVDKLVKPANQEDYDTILEELKLKKSIR